MFQDLFVHRSIIIFATAAITVLSPTLVSSMLDVNFQELQYVADHLTDHKCSQLMEALREKAFQLSRTSTASPERAKNTTEEPCVTRLETWSRGSGQNRTVEYLSLRLREIGLPKLSSKVSSFVMKETSEQLHRFFLDDPFKDMIPTASVVVDEGEGDTDTKELLSPELGRNEDKNDHLFAAVIVMFTVGVSLFASISVCLLCPQAGHFVCMRACPGMCASCYEIVVESCQRVWFGAKSNVNKYMLVAPNGAGTGGGLAV